MKKYLIFTSVLTLAACGGGSGGGGVDTRSAVIDSNAKITGMKSFVVVGGDNPTVNTNARVSTSLANGAMQYDLDNVVFQSADKEFSTEPDEDFVVRFKIANNHKYLQKVNMLISLKYLIPFLPKINLMLLPYSEESCSFVTKD